MAANAQRILLILALAAAGCGRATLTPTAAGPSLTPTSAAASASGTVIDTPSATPPGENLLTAPAPTAGTPTSTASPAPSATVNPFLPTATALPPTAAPPQSLTAANAVSVTLLAAFGPGLLISGTEGVTGTVPANVRLEQVVWGPGEGQVAVAGAAGVLVYDRATGALAQRIVTSAWATSLALWPEGHALAAGTVNATVEVYDTRDGELRALLNGPGVQVAQVRYVPVPGSVLPAGYAVASLGVNNTLHWWDVALQAYLGPLTLGPSPAQRVDWSERAPFGRQWLAAAAGNVVSVWALPTLLEAAPAFDAVPPTRELAQPAPLTTLALSADGHWLAAANTGGTILIWDLSDPSAPPQALARQAYPAEALAFSPSGDLLAAAHGDRLIRLWAVDGGAQPLAALAGPSDRITSVAFSPDRRELAAAGWEGVVRVWGIAD